MATRSKVGFKNSDGTINASYVHFDGYLSGVGVALVSNHDSDSKARKLGYAKGIRSIELDSPVSYYNDMENETYESEDAFHDEVVKDSSIEYGYLYDPSRGWLFSSSKYGTNEFIELEDQLMYDELLPGSGDAPDMDMMENVSISKLREVEVGVVDKIQDEEEMGLEEAFDDLVKKVDKAKGYTKKEAEKVAGAIAAKKMKGAGKGPTAKQKARVKEEMTDSEKEKLKDISDELKGAVKAHGKQAKAIDKVLKEDIYDSMRGLTLKEYFKRFTK